LNKKEIKRRKEKRREKQKEKIQELYKKEKPVAPVHNFDNKILPEGSGKLRWAGRGRPKFDRFYIFLWVE
jgi:hypothetical protein